MTYGEIAQALFDKGILASFDWALPQDFFTDVFNVTGLNPAGQIVWSYKNSIFGFPFPITLKGWQILVMYVNGKGRYAKFVKEYMETYYECNRRPQRLG